MIQVNRIYLIFNRLVTKKFLVDTSEMVYEVIMLYHFHMPLYFVGTFTEYPLNTTGAIKSHQ